MCDQIFTEVHVLRLTHMETGTEEFLCRQGRAGSAPYWDPDMSKALQMGLDMARTMCDGFKSTGLVEKGGFALSVTNYVEKASKADIMKSLEGE